MADQVMSTDDKFRVAYDLTNLILRTVEPSKDRTKDEILDIYLDCRSVVIAAKKRSE